MPDSTIIKLGVKLDSLSCFQVTIFIKKWVADQLNEDESDCDAVNDIPSSSTLTAEDGEYSV
jgi:hypothetical protein